MSLTLQEIIDAARDRDPAFAKQRVPDAIFARQLTGYQKFLVAAAHERRPGIIQSQISIVISPSSGLPGTTPIGTIGAGTTGGLPVQLSADGSSYQSVEQSVGNTIELDIGNAAVLWPQTVVVSATSNTLTASPAIAWTVNQFANMTVLITDGTDVFDRRTIVSNTANVLTVTPNFAVTPDATSLFTIVSLQPVVTQETSAVIGLPALGQRYHYLQKIDANGNPYLDYTAPLIGMFQQGIPLPPHKSLLHGDVYFSGSNDPLSVMPFVIVDVSHRNVAWGNYCAWTDNANLYLIGRQEDWQNVTSIDLRYVPEPAPLTQLTDFFVLPDSAYTPLVEWAAWMAAARVYNAPDTPNVDMNVYVEARDRAEVNWLNEIGTRKRAETSYVVETW